MRKGDLFHLCNQFNSVFDACNKFYCCIVIIFALKYRREKRTIVDMDAMSKQMQADLNA